MVIRAPRLSLFSLMKVRWERINGKRDPHLCVSLHAIMSIKCRLESSKVGVSEFLFCGRWCRECTYAAIMVAKPTA